MEIKTQNGNLYICDNGKTYVLRSFLPKQVQLSHARDEWPSVSLNFVGTELKSVDSLPKSRNTEEMKTPKIREVLNSERILWKN